MIPAVVINSTALFQVLNFIELMDYKSKVH